MLRSSSRRWQVRPSRAGEEAGFNLVELMVVTLIMSVVLAIAGGILVSVSDTAKRNDAMISQEQKASSALAQVSRDIRSTHSLGFPSGALPADVVQLKVNQPGGATKSVKWVYDASAGTFTRYVLNGSGVFVRSGPVLTGVANPSGTPVFGYFNFTGGTALGTPSDVAQCTTRMTVTLYVSAGTSGVPAFKVTDDVAITDQLAYLTRPGGPCGSAA